MTEDFKPVEWWDEVHRTAKVESLGGTTFGDYQKFLSTIGPFDSDLDNATAVMDVGPGLGRFLAGVCNHKQRFAIELSPENHVKLRERGISTFFPGELSEGADAAFHDFVGLATCISVFQHCSDTMVKTLLADVWASLQPRATLYCNGVSEYEGASAEWAWQHNSAEYKTRAGRWSHPLRAILSWANAMGFNPGGMSTHRLEDVRLDTWVLRLTKD